jgi:uncharacterized membrane protein
MEYVLFVCLIILIFFVVGLRNSVMDRFDKLERELQRWREDAKRLAGSAPGAPSSGHAPTPSSAPAPVPANPAQPPTARPEPVRETEPFQPHFTRQPEPPRPDPVRSQPATSTPQPTASRPTPRTPEPPRPGFFERHPDLEKFIGENLVSKIGIAILVLAIGFFVKYAIDNDWIGPVGRVGVGVLCGGILIGIAHWLRKQYKAFSSVLVGGGLAVLYFTIALAYHQYQLFGQTTAFVIMLVITAFSVLLSLLYDRQELAIIALAGGFFTPFLVSNGRGDYVVLFSYLLILNGGLLVIAYNKAWRLLNILAFGFTAILFLTWLISLPYDAKAATFRGGWLFATTFYLLFFVINVAYTVRTNKRFIASDFGILLANTCLYFAAGLYFIGQLGLDRYKGLYCAVMGIFHLGATWFLFRKNTIDKNILYLLVGITLSFVSLTAPLQLHGHYITLFWATESVLLYWLFLKSQIRLIRLASLLIWLAMLVSLGMDWLNNYFTSYDVPGTHLRPGEILPILFNKGFMTGLYSALCCGALYYLDKQGFRGRTALVAGIALLFIDGILEINCQMERFFPGTGLSWLYLTGYTYLYILVLARFERREKAVRWKSAGRPSQRGAAGPMGGAAAGLLVAAVLLYLGTLPAMFDLQAMMLERGRYQGHFTAHWIGVVIVVLILRELIGRQRNGLMQVEGTVFTWLICGITVILLSAEGQLLVNAVFYSHNNELDYLARVYNKTGLPILWGLCSFVFMWLGMRYKFKPLRIISLLLFSITLLKLFLFDIRNIPIAGKIAAFFCLGVLLLVVSFMYQRLKKIIIEDEEKKTV